MAQPQQLTKSEAITVFEHIPWLQFKGKREQERERKEYQAWAYPYGEAQAEKVKELLKEIFPREDEKMSLVCFLTAKEIFSPEVREAYYTGDRHEKAVNVIRKELKYYRYMFPKGTGTTYMALGMADAQIGPELQYPTCDELRRTASQLDGEIQKIQEYLDATGKKDL